MPRSFVHAPTIADDAHGLASYPPLLAKLLINRGYTDPDAAERYLKPSYDAHMHDPFLMHDMRNAIERLYTAIKGGEKIIIYADYDCDGIPGAVIMHDFLTRIGYENFSVYIPDRHTEGYGLNETAVAGFLERGVGLVFTIDLGTTNHDEIATLQAAGIDVIVTDHHLPHETLPEAFALVNPKVGDTYPEPMLCGSGVVFKLVQGFLETYGTEFGVGSGWEKWMLDMAGLATLSDMVPLSGENRVIASFGMQVFRKSPRPGLMQLLRKAGIDQTTITEDDVTFMITPRLNAASRMDSPMRAFELLSVRDGLKAGMAAEHLTKINDERKSLVAGIMKDAKKKLAERELGPVIVVGNPGWRVGILGLVAGKIMDEFDRPVFVWGREGAGETTAVKGSCRSNGSVNVVELMTAAKEHFLEFGGHELAGGFSLAENAVHMLEEKLCGLYESHRREGETDGVQIDAILSLGEVTDETCRMIDRLAPFGLGNPKPLFMFPNVLIQKTKQFGKEKNHFEMTISDGSSQRTAMSFFADENTFTRRAVVGERVDLIATIEKSYFAGRITIRLRIVDIL